ncbi:hypothetical protein VTK73DRAFT_6183 [Phialemonium thermophilum]|uniref:Uncharacterized protein n=1 Tax=Phialemonium thermophilum TaxID=223376 RepID=A0ABR3V041_9PEZI
MENAMCRKSFKIALLCTLSSDVDPVRGPLGTFSALSWAGRSGTQPANQQLHRPLTISNLAVEKSPSRARHHCTPASPPRIHASTGRLSLRLAFLTPSSRARASQSPRPSITSVHHHQPCLCRVGTPPRAARASCAWPVPFDPRAPSSRTRRPGGTIPPTRPTPRLPASSTRSAN